MHEVQPLAVAEALEEGAHGRRGLAQRLQGVQGEHGVVEVGGLGPPAEPAVGKSQAAEEGDRAFGRATQKPGRSARGPQQLLSQRHGKDPSC